MPTATPRGSTPTGIRGSTTVLHLIALSFRMPGALVWVVALAVALVWFFAPLTHKAHAQSTQTPWQNLTQSQLTAVWWQWLYSVPAWARHQPELMASVR
jgi:hypothetical protein